MTPDTRVLLAKAGVIQAARRLTTANPGAHVELELALRRLNESERARAMQRAEVTPRSLDCGSDPGAA